MIRRTCVISVVVFVVSVMLAAPALAYGPYQSWSVPSPPGVTDTCLVQGTSQAVVMWSEPGGGATSRIMAKRVSLETGTATDPIAVVTDINMLEGWKATGDGTNVTVLWKNGASIYTQRVDLGDGSKKYEPVLLCTDAQVTALRGVASTAAPAGIDADGQGGAYVWCAVTPTSTSGDSLLDHVTATGAPAATDLSKMLVPGGTIAALDSDSEGHAFALLGAPGRTGVAVQRYTPALTPDWNAPRSPYLVGGPSATPEPVGLVASADALLAWREGGEVKAQRFTTDGDRLWLLPPALSMPAGAVALASDHWGGAYVVGPSGDGIAARHILSTGREAAWGASALTGLGYTTPRSTPSLGTLPATSSSPAATLHPPAGRASSCSRTQARGVRSARRSPRSGTRAPCPTVSAAPTCSARAGVRPCGASPPPAPRSQRVLAP